MYFMYTFLLGLCDILLQLLHFILKVGSFLAPIVISFISLMNAFDQRWDQATYLILLAIFAAMPDRTYMRD